MEQSEFDGLVTQSAAVDDAEPTVRATLATLGDAVAAGQAEAIAKWLPDVYADVLGETTEQAESLSYETFTERVREREADHGAETSGEVQARAAAVADALATTVPHDELLDLRSQLPDRIGSLFTEGQGVR